MNGTVTEATEYVEVGASSKAIKVHLGLTVTGLFVMAGAVWQAADWAATSRAAMKEWQIESLHTFEMMRKDISSISEELERAATDRWRGLDTVRYRNEVQAAINAWRLECQDAFRVSGVEVKLPQFRLPEPFTSE